mmetsp:Transcript_22733/g.61606  ORF Transcript_22733/g.61606 Transcript_22733/m.61606 type:complete len:89 (+) Transcript_22733:676-942(+)
MKLLDMFIVHSPPEEQDVQRSNMHDIDSDALREKFVVTVARVHLNQGHIARRELSRRVFDSAVECLAAKQQSHTARCAVPDAEALTRA